MSGEKYRPKVIPQLRVGRWVGFLNLQGLGNLTCYQSPIIEAFVRLNEAG